jgi:hypothetical protein
MRLFVKRISALATQFIEVTCADIVVSVASSHVGRSHEVWIPYIDAASLREYHPHAIFRHH